MTKNELKATCYHEAGHAIVRQALGFTVERICFWPEPDPEEPLSAEHNAMTFSRWEGESDPKKWSPEVLADHYIGVRAGELAEIGASKRALIKHVSAATREAQAIDYEQVPSQKKADEAAQDLVDGNWKAIEGLAKYLYGEMKDGLENNWVLDLTEAEPETS